MYSFRHAAGERAGRFDLGFGARQYPLSSACIWLQQHASFPLGVNEAAACSGGGTGSGRAK